jgi:hypothetical protein
MVQCRIILVQQNNRHNPTWKPPPFFLRPTRLSFLFILCPSSTSPKLKTIGTHKKSKYFKRIAVILLVVSVFLQSWLMLPEGPAHCSSSWFSPSQPNSLRSRDNMKLLARARPGRARQTRQSTCLASQVSTFFQQRRELWKPNSSNPFLFRPTRFIN